MEEKSETGLQGSDGSTVFSVVVCSSNQYSHYVPPLFESILLNCTSSLRFFVICSHIDDSNKQSIRRIVAQKDGCSVAFVHFDFLSEVKATGLTEEFPSFRNSYDTYSRLFLTKLLFRDLGVERVLYLDIDMVVSGPLDPLFRHYFHDRLIGAVLDSGAGREQGIPEGYFNTGMLLLNLRRLEEFDFTGKALKCFTENRGKLRFFDQDILNMLIPQDEIDYVDEVFNMQFSSADRVRKGVILHFTGPDKPWSAKCAWRYKKCMWKKYQILSSLFLRGCRVTPVTERLIHYVLVIARPLLGLVRKLKLLVGRT